MQSDVIIPLSHTDKSLQSIRNINISFISNVIFSNLAALVARWWYLPIENLLKMQQGELNASQILWTVKVINNSYLFDIWWLLEKCSLKWNKKSISTCAFMHSDNMQTSSTTVMSLSAFLLSYPIFFRKGFACI